MAELIRGLRCPQLQGMGLCRGSDQTVPATAWMMTLRCLSGHWGPKLSLTSLYSVIKPIEPKRDDRIVGWAFCSQGQQQGNVTMHFGGLLHGRSASRSRFSQNTKARVLSYAAPCIVFEK